MPSLKLTKAAIDRLKAPDPSGNQMLHWDTDLKGFGLLCSGVSKAKTYIAQFTLPRPDGRTRRITVGSVQELSLDQARVQAAELIHQMRQGIDPKAVRRSAAAWTLRRALEEYVKARKDLKPHTIKDYRVAIERYLPDWLDLPLASINGDMVEARHIEIQADIERRKGTHPEHWNSAPGAHMANSVMTTLRSLWNFVEVRVPDLPRNPVNRLRRQWFQGPRRERMVRPDQLPAFWAAVETLDNLNVRDFIKLLLFSGLRRNEGAALRWDEIDFAAKVWKLPRERTKNNQPHEVPLSTLTVSIIQTMPRIADSPYVFTTNGRAAFSGFSKVVRRLRSLLPPDMPQWTLHDLRRTCASGMARLGINLPVIEKVLNHSSGSFARIVGVYQRHNFAEEKRAALEVWAQHVAGLTQKKR